MEFRRLCDTLHSRHLRQDISEQTSLVQQLESPARAAFGEDARKLVANPLGGDFQNLAVQTLDGAHGRGVDLVIETSGEAHGAQQPQMILAKTRFRIADGAY